MAQRAPVSIPIYLYKYIVCLFVCFFCFCYVHMSSNAASLCTYTRISHRADDPNKPLTLQCSHIPLIPLDRILHQVNLNGWINKTAKINIWNGCRHEHAAFLGTYLEKRHPEIRNFSQMTTCYHHNPI